MTTYPRKGIKIILTPKQEAALAKKPELEAGKEGIQWRQGRAGYVCTVSGKDVLGVNAAMCEQDAIEQVAMVYGEAAAARFNHLNKSEQ